MTTVKELLRETAEDLDKTAEDDWDLPPTIYLRNNEKVTAICVVAGVAESKDDVMQGITSALGGLLNEHEDTVSVTVTVEAITWFIDANDPRSVEQQKAENGPVEIRLVMACTAEEVMFAVKKRGDTDWQLSTQEQARGTVGEFLVSIAQITQPLLKESR